MNQLDIITIVFAGMIGITILFAIWLYRSFYKPIGDDRVKLNDDAPARYEEFEECFYNP